jgi:ribonuclease P/MRP protein subunit POP5
MVIDQKELYYAIADAVTSLWGDAMAGIISQAVVAAEHGHVIIRCQRGTERELMIALSTVTVCRETGLALRIVATSGTMESLRERIRPQKPEKPDGSENPEEPGNPERPERPDLPAADPSAPDVTFGRKTWTVLQCNGGKVDVIEKGFKNTGRLFLTAEDLEVV